MGSQNFSIGAHPGNRGSNPLGVTNFLKMKVVYAISVLAGTIIGAGLFSLPYITSVVGFRFIVGYLVVMTAISIVVHLFLGKVSLKTPDFMRLPGFAKHHLGKKGETVAYISGILGILGAILAYLILGGEFLYALFSPVMGGGVAHYLIAYFIVGAAFIYFGISVVSKAHMWGLIIYFVLLAAMLFRGWGEFSLDNLFFMREGAFDFFLPYGALLFSLWGGALIPEVEEILGSEKKKLPVVIVASIIISSLISLFFIITMLGISGEGVAYNALGGLRGLLSNGVVAMALTFGVVATFTSFVSLGLTLKKIFWYDLKLNRILSWAITCFVPLFLFIIGVRDFILVIGTVGAVMLAIDAILVSLMYEKINIKRVRFITYPLIAVFLFGIIYEIVYFIR